MEEKTVEQQILESEFVTKLKEKLGDAGEDLGKTFVNLNNNEQLITIFFIVMRIMFRVKEGDAKKLVKVLTYLSYKEEIATNAFLEVFIDVARQKVSEVAKDFLNDEK